MFINKETYMQSEYQLKLPSQTIETADPKGKPLLQGALAKLGFVPNMYARMANSPGLLDTYLRGYAAFRTESGFTPAEQEVIFLTISRENGCEYCVAAHSFMADVMSKVPEAVTAAIRNDTPNPDAKLAALEAFVQTMVQRRGLPSEASVTALLAAGYGDRHILEIVLAIGVKTLSNYANHLFHTPLDAAFTSRIWTDKLK